MGEYAGLILAAGYSSRMGRFKPLLDFGGQPLVLHQVGLLRAAGARRVIVVTGHRHAELEAALAGTGVETVHNPRYDEGMFSSVQAGARALTDGVQLDAFFLLPVDFPLAPTLQLKLQMQAYEKEAPAAVYPSFAMRRGHPPLLHARLLPQILAYGGDGGLRGALGPVEDIAYVEMWDGRAQMDMDTEDTYHKVLDIFAQKSVRSRDVCDWVYETLAVPANVQNHCAAVAQAVKALGGLLEGKVPGLDWERIYYAALLHDIKKGASRHDLAGAEILSQMGYEETAALIRCHMDMAPAHLAGLNDASLLFYADKVTEGGTLCPLASRRERMQARSAANATYIQKRLDDAAVIEGQISQALGRPAFEALREALASQ